MNEMDREYLQSQGFIDEDGRVIDSRLQSRALLEAVMFAGALLEKENDLNGLQTVASFLEESAAKKDYAFCHQYAQQCFKNCRNHGELDGFYTASLDEDALMVFAIYFCVYLGNLVSKLNETQLSIEVNRIYLEMTRKKEREILFIPAANKEMEVGANG